MAERVPVRGLISLDRLAARLSLSLTSLLWKQALYYLLMEPIRELSGIPCVQIPVKTQGHWQGSVACPWGVQGLTRAV